MKNLKLFLTGMLASCVAVAGVNAANVNGGVCTAANKSDFKDCLTDSFARVIKVTGNFDLDENITVDNRRIVVDSSQTLTVSGKLTLTNFAVREDADAYVTGSGDIQNNKLINVLLDTNAKLVVTGELDARTSGGNTIAISKRSEKGWNTNEGTLEVDGGKVSISGYGHTALRTNAVVIKNGGNVEVSNCAGAANIGNMIVSENSEYYSHDNDRGLTTANGLTAEDNAKITVVNNKYSGIFTSGTISDNAVVTSNNNGTDGDIGVTGTGIELSGNATLNAGNVTVPYSSAKLTVATGSGNNVKLNVEQFAKGSFDAPTSGLTGVVHVDNKYYVYTLDNGKTVEVGTNTGDGVIKVFNYTGKEISVTTPDSTHVEKIAGADKIIYFVTLTVDGKDDKVSLFKGQTFGELSETGKAKLDAMLNVEGQHINNYYDTKEVKLVDSSAFAENTKIHATHFIILSIGNYEIWVNPGTSLSDLTGEDLEKLETIKTGSDRKFMYFAVNGKAISEEDTKFNADTTILVLYEGDEAPVVPDTPENQPTKPDDQPAESTPGSGSETEGNPNTLDSLPLYLIGGAVAVLGVAGLGYSIKKKFEN